MTPAPGQLAPDFTLPDADGNDVALADLRGKNVIVYFYPAAMTPGCTKQACDFRDSLDSLQAAGYAVLGISPDKPTKLAKFRERDALTLTPQPDAVITIASTCSTYGHQASILRRMSSRPPSWSFMW